MNLLLRFTLSTMLFVASGVTVSHAGFNTLSAEERRLGFGLLFDGRNFEGWTQDGTWAVEDEALFCREPGKDISFTERFMPDDFELRFEWKVSKGANSGVIYRPGLYEYQILDNPNSRLGVSPRTSAASLFFCMGPSRDVTRPHGEWNEGRIVCKGTVIQHWLNGEKVIDFDYTDPRWAKNLEMLRIRDARSNLAARGGFLRLQNHGGGVWFRNLRLREIPEDEQLVRSNVEPMPVSAEGLAYEAMRMERILTRVRDEAERPEGELYEIRNLSAPE